MHEEDAARRETYVLQLANELLAPDMRSFTGQLMLTAKPSDAGDCRPHHRLGNSSHYHHIKALAHMLLWCLGRQSDLTAPTHHAMDQFPPRRWADDKISGLRSSIMEGAGLHAAALGGTPHGKDYRGCAATPQRCCVARHRPVC